MKESGIGWWIFALVYAPLLALFGSAIVIAGLRVYGLHGQTFQAISHLYVGGLIGAFLVRGWPDGYLFLYLALALSFIEVLAACGAFKGFL